MPRTEVVVFKEDDTSVPLVEWAQVRPEKGADEVRGRSGAA